MSMFKIGEHIKKPNLLSVPHMGTVVDNMDPKKLGRVKCTIPTIMDGAPDKLPWIYPMAPIGLGGSLESCTFSVPEMDSRLTIVFPFDDVHAPFYIGYWRSEKTQPHETFDESEEGAKYPEIYGHINSKGDWFLIAKDQEWMKAYHHTGTFIKVDKYGDVYIEQVRDMYMENARDIFIENGRDIQIGNGRDIVLSNGNDIDIVNGNNITINNGTDINIDTGGNVTINVGGNVDLTAGGNVRVTAAMIFQNS